MVCYPFEESCEFVEGNPVSNDEGARLPLFRAKRDRGQCVQRERRLFKLETIRLRRHWEMKVLVRNAKGGKGAKLTLSNANQSFLCVREAAKLFWRRYLLLECERTEYVNYEHLTTKY